ncbi:MAG: hypothetical protein ABJG88_05295 [Litorimonas sp.]
MEFASRIIVTLFGVWMMGVSLWMFAAPHGALSALRKMGSTRVIHFTELGLRLCVGLAMMGLALFTDQTRVLRFCGMFLALTALIIIPIPHKIHNRYALWWASRISPWALRIMAPVSFAAGLWSLWAALD